MTQDVEVPAEAAPVPADSTPAGTGAYSTACSHPPLEGTGLVCTACEPSDPDPSYLEMFREYLAEQKWITMAERPLVFHLERLCKQLDRDPSAPAAVSSAYLQAFSRLDRRRPGAPSGPGDDPAQTSIFDELD